MNDSQRERKREYNKKWHQLNKEKNKEKKAEYDKKYKEKNKEKISKYRELNKEKTSEYNKKYRELNREKRREYEREYRVENKEHMREQRKEKRAHCIEYLGGKCVKCGTTHNLQFDHIKRDTKKYTIAGRVRRNFTILKEELDKCQLLCVDCHKIKTKSEWADITQRGDGQSVAIV